MEVSLLSYNPHAADLLIMSKRTRLKMTSDAFIDIVEMADEEKQKELEYVFGTIGSSWEFSDYIFLVTGVSRAFTHELVRTRQASYAQQSMRAVDMSDFDYIEFDEDNAEMKKIYDGLMVASNQSYKDLVKGGTQIQRARGVLPTNICTNIMVKINLRALSNLMNDRLCFRAAGEYQEVAKEMRNIVLEVHPWAKPVLQANCVQYGFCKFKNFKDCPMKTQGFIKDCDSEMLEREWNRIKLVVQPKVEKK